MKTKQFVEYVLDFYGKENGIYKETFGQGVSEKEVLNALELRKKNKAFKFVGDTFDRELVRDIMIVQRALSSTEYDVTEYMKPMMEKRKAGAV